MRIKIGILPAVIVSLQMCFAVASYGESAHEYFKTGVLADQVYSYAEAIAFYEKAAELYKQSGNKGEHAVVLKHIGIVYRALGQYDRAIEHFRKALAINEELWQKGEIAISLRNIGEVYRALGQYDRAIELFRKALAINEELGQKDEITIDLVTIGCIYYEWGQYDRAIEHFRKALAINEELGQKQHIAAGLNNIGMVYKAWGQYDRAIEHFRKAFTIAEELGEKDSIATYLNNIGSVYKAWGQYDKAMEHYRKALAINEELGQKGDIARDLNNIGSIYHDWGKYDRAIEHYGKALAIVEELKEKDNIAGILSNIGTVYYDTNDFKNAIHYFEKSVVLKESLRLTAEGDIRRDYLAAEIYTYRFLASAYLQHGSAEQAFNAVELASAKYLSEQLRGKLDIVPSPFEIRKYPQMVSPHRAVVNFANLERNKVIVLVASRGGVMGKEVNKKEFISRIDSQYTATISAYTERSRGIALVLKTGDKKDDKKEKDNLSFDRIIDYYRHLLTKAEPTPKESSARVFIARELYNLLFGEIENDLAGKSDLVIIPGGVFAFVPFETLIMPDGRYLAEKYDIKYTQSLTVSEIIEKRVYRPNRKAMIAFGGAVYDEEQYKADMITSEGQLKALIVAVNRGEDSRRTYAGLGYAWSNLPGTLVEVKAIKSLMENAVIYTGDTVTKSNFLKMSKNGDLQKYKVIHLATHGLVTPEAPELSAVVFSQFKNPRHRDDGYLRAREILGLALNADFINLSACETGLGKLYSGEGVVGLTQSFLIAGANGLSVSLWSVADESTTEFMAGMYKLVIEKQMTYGRAMAEMKRRFIAHTKWNNPYYWAPFVYYGK